MATKTAQKTRPSFKVWYDSNKEEYNRKRRLRYKKDKKYREAQLASTRSWRKTTKKLRKKAEPVVRPGYSVKDAAREIGCAVETLRNFEKAGLIPRVTPSTSREHRRYSENQVQLIAELFEFRKTTHYKDTGYTKGLAKVVTRVKKLWG